MPDRLLRPTSTPPPRASLRVQLFLPLLGFLVPSAVIGYGFVLPRSGAGGINELSVGFGATLVGAAVTYAVGVLAALRR